MKTTDVSKPVEAKTKLVAVNGQIKMVEQTDTADDFIHLMVAPYGIQGSGKTRLGVTGRGVIGAIPLDRKSIPTLKATAKELGKRLFLPNVDLVRAPNPMKTFNLPTFCKSKKGEEGMSSREMAEVTAAMDIFKKQPECCSIHHYRWHVQRVKYSLIEMCQVADTIIIDNGTTLWDDILCANHGRTDKINPIDRQSDNKEIKEILDICVSKDLVIPHREGETWANNKPTGKVEFKGYGHLGYEVSAIVRMSRDKKDGSFYCDVEMSQANAALHGSGGHHDVTELVDDNINMAFLATLMYPDVDWSENWY